MPPEAGDNIGEQHPVEKQDDVVKPPEKLKPLLSDGEWFDSLDVPEHYFNVRDAKGNIIKRPNKNEVS